DRLGAHRRVHRRRAAAHRRRRHHPREGPLDAGDDRHDGALRRDARARAPRGRQGHGRVRGLHQARRGRLRGGGLHRPRGAARGRRRSQVALRRRGARGREGPRCRDARAPGGGAGV
ncbi:MAG: hypothetical protein AVDCRST_MAG85-2693, partial [uncultured Solirubrobacteraceae bacterium]